jgi:glyoxylase-like metal-dependent hydrolase (beta-lactamase superfamily II)
MIFFIKRVAQELEGLPQEIALIPLIGHTYGHAGVAVKADKWLFNTGDAYFYHQEMNLESPHCTPGLELYQTLMEKDRKSRLMNQDRLRELKKKHGDEIEIFCSHDPTELVRLSGRSMEMPYEEGLSLR